eukprot:scaffold1012_cov124-Isochrysis_galbana.AAC.2
MHLFVWLVWGRLALALGAGGWRSRCEAATEDGAARTRPSSFVPRLARRDTPRPPRLFTSTN